MGWFQYNYNKPGPGVSKSEPEKKAFFHFFELYGRKFFKLMYANLLYVMVSLPIVTGGLAQAGLTYVTRNYVREKHVFLPTDFFTTIKKNWKQATVVHLIDLFVSTLLAFNLYFYAFPLLFEGSGLSDIFFTAVILLLMSVVSVMRYYVYIQLITFKLTVKQIFKNSFMFVFAGLKQNILLSVILLGIYAVLLVFALFVPGFIAMQLLVALYLCFFPAFRSFLIQFTVFPLIKKAIIDPYYAEHPDEDVQQRQDLNLETPEQPQEETVFEDIGRAEHAASSESNVSIPRQYSAEELRRSVRSRDADEDGTI